MKGVIKTVAFATLLIASAGATSKAQVTLNRSPSGKIKAVEIVMALAVEKASSDDRLLMSGTASYAGADMGLRIELDKAEQGVHEFEFEARFGRLGEASAIIDRLLADSFPESKGQTLFKAKGLIGSATVHPATLIKDGGVFTIRDVGVEGGFFWNARVEIDVERMQMKVLIYPTGF